MMKKYPIQYKDGREFVPFGMMLEHEQQCYINHGQSVQRLAERSGTDYLETYYILSDRKYQHARAEDLIRIEESARRIVHAKAYEWLMEHNQLN